MAPRMSARPHGRPSRRTIPAMALTDAPAPETRDQANTLIRLWEDKRVVTDSSAIGRNTALLTASVDADTCQFVGESAQARSVHIGP